MEFLPRTLLFYFVQVGETTCRCHDRKPHTKRQMLEKSVAQADFWATDFCCDEALVSNFWHLDIFTPCGYAQEIRTFVECPPYFCWFWFYFLLKGECFPTCSCPQLWWITQHTSQQQLTCPDLSSDLDGCVHVFDPWDARKPMLL